MRRYLLFTILLSVSLLACFYVVQKFLLIELFHDFFPILITFFFLQSIVISWILRQGEKNKSSFPIYVIASIGFRMITGLFLLVVFFVLEVEKIRLLAIQFVIVYLVYLVFELMVVLSNLRRN